VGIAKKLGTIRKVLFLDKKMDSVKKEVYSWRRKSERTSCSLLQGSSMGLSLFLANIMAG
jgi:hypothetical protein